MIRYLLLMFTVLAAAAFSFSDAHAQDITDVSNPASETAYALQLVPFKSRSEADKWLAEMSRRGYQPYLHEGHDNQGRHWYAVRLGRYATAEAAGQALTKFKQSENMAAFVTRQDTIFPDAGRRGTDPGTVPLPASAALVQATADLNALQAQVDALQRKMAELEKENEARRMLRMTKEEEKERESEILSAAGREYTLIPKNRLGFELGMYYSYFSSDILEDLRNSEGSRLNVERRGNHNLTSQLFAEYGVLNNLSMNLVLPFVYKYDRRSVSPDREVTDLGDISMAVQYQPLKARATWPALIFSLNGSFPTGRSPYKINPDSDLATGNGYYAIGGGLNFSKTLDPVVAYGGINYNHPFETSDTEQLQSDGSVLSEVEAGDSMGMSLGMGLALSYRTSLNLSYQYAYHMESVYRFDDGTEFESNSWVTSSLGIGVGWRISPRFSIYTRVDIGLTGDDSDFTFSIRIPVRFNTGG